MNHPVKDIKSILPMKADIIAGLCLFLMAACFSVLIMTAALGYTVTGVALGQMILAAYGFCSCLIPAFLFTVGVVCFLHKWTYRLAVRLLTALLPFFTLAATESTCRSIYELGTDSFTGAKVSITIALGVMLVIIEYLGAGIIGDKLALRYAKKSREDETFKDETEAEKKDFTVTEKSKKQHPKVETDAIEGRLDELDDVGEAEDGGDSNGESKEISEEEGAGSKTADVTAGKKTGLFDHVFDERGRAKEDGGEVADAMPSAESVKDKGDEGVAVKDDTQDDSMQLHAGGAVITEEEYNALTSDTPAEISWDNMDSGDENDTVGPVDETVSDEELHTIVGEGDEKKNESGEVEKPLMSSPIETEGEDTYSTVPYSPMPYTEDEIKDEVDTEKAKEVIEAAVDVALESNIEDRAETATEAQGGTADALDEDFFDIDINESDIDEVEYADDSAVVNAGAHNSSIPVPSSSIDGGAEMEGGHVQSVSDVFAQMDADVRRELNIEGGAKSEAEDESIESDTLDSVKNNADVRSDAASDIRQIEDTDDSANTEGYYTENNKDVTAKTAAIIAEPQSVSDVVVEQSAASLSPMLDKKSGIQDDSALSIAPLPVLQGINTATASIPLVERPLPRVRGPYTVPSSLLTEYADDEYWVIDSGTQRASATLKETLGEFHIEAEVVGIRKGPVVTMFELLPAPGVKLSKIVALQDNIALRLAASSVRIVAPIPGKKAVGIEIPNKKRSIVGFREIIEQDASEFKSMVVPVILGKDILGHPQIIDLVKTPHLLIAGATGAGKSVCVNSMILSILYKRSPDDVKLILIDPKVVELKLYNDIPHLLVPVITETKKALQALQWALCEMERRYSMLDRMGCREIASYNKKIVEKNIACEKMPYIIIIIDEFADLMATSGKELESTVARLAAMSRAVGIHLALATQRPSIDVITGLIKANIPSRIAFMVASKTDSRIIIDQVGAEKLLGKGDMLYASAVDPYPTRIQGTFVSDQEVENVVDYIKQYDTPDYIEDEVFVSDDDDSVSDPSEFGDGEDPLYDEALQIVMQAGKASASYIQRRLKIGYNRAARLVEDMETRGIVGPANGSKPREIVHVP